MLFLGVLYMQYDAYDDNKEDNIIHMWCLAYHPGDLTYPVDGCHDGDQVEYDRHPDQEPELLRVNNMSCEGHSQPVSSTARCCCCCCRCHLSSLLQVSGCIPDKPHRHHRSEFVKRKTKNGTSIPGVRIIHAYKPSRLPNPQKYDVFPGGGGGSPKNPHRWGRPCKRIGKPSDQKDNERRFCSFYLHFT